MRSAELKFQVEGVFCEECDKRLEGEMTTPALRAFASAHRLHQHSMRFDAILVAPVQWSGRRMSLQFHARSSDDWKLDPPVQTSAVEDGKL